MNPKVIRIIDIARLAGVSKGTVDRVLHKRGRVSEKALQQVLKVMQEIDYKPNLIARTLGSNRNYRVAALIPDPAHDGYWEQTYLGVTQAQEEWAHYGISVYTRLFDQYHKESFKQAALEVLGEKPDGLLTAPIFYDEALPVFSLFAAQGIPYILFNTNIPEVNALSFIGQDLYHSGMVGGELMALGQPHGGKLLILHLDEDFQNSPHLLEKERGFRAYFSHGSDCKFEIRACSLDPDHHAFQQALASALSDEGITGIFVSTSKGTAVVASFLEQAGKKHIRLIGYDILEQNQKYLRSGTIDFVINQNPKRQAFLGISQMVNHLLFEKKPPATELFPLEVITPQNLNSYLGSRIH